MAQRYQVSVQEYVSTRSLRDFSEDVMAYYCEVLAPVAAVAEAFGGAGEDEPKKPGAKENTRPANRKKRSWFKPKPNSNIHSIGRIGEPIPMETTKALRNAARRLGG